MTFAASTRHTARKMHVCAICRSRIPVGLRHLKMVGKWDGDFYAERMHDDCHTLWNALFNDWGDPSDGMLYDLAEVFCDSGEDRAVREALDDQRGFFPHAVCRIEFRLRHWLEGDEE